VPTTVTECAQELVKTYNEMVSQGFTAARAGWEQAASNAKGVAETSQTEQAAAGKIWEETIACSRDHTEKMAKLTRKFAANPNASMTDETKELIDGIVTNDQQLFKSCAEYAQGVEQRRAQLTASMLRANAEFVASAQGLAKSAFDCSHAFMDWSFAVARGSAPTAPF
jgi:hypothetical protein